MERLIEIIRKLGISAIWIFGGGISLLSFISGIINSNTTYMMVGAGLLLLTYVVSKLVNWILKKQNE